MSVNSQWLMVNDQLPTGEEHCRDRGDRLQAGSPKNKGVICQWSFVVRAHLQRCVRCFSDWFWLLFPRILSPDATSGLLFLKDFYG